MMQILLVDSPLLFREYLREKLSVENITVGVSQNIEDAIQKMKTLVPQLIVLNIEKSFSEVSALLETKMQDPVTLRIPVVVTGPVASRDSVSKLVPYNVVRYFNKPINFDLFFEFIGRILKIAISLDKTPCILETHVNNDIIFVEIAQGLNREKLSLLKYKLSEIIDANKISEPKVVLMMTALSLDFMDGCNVEILLDSVTYDKRILKKNIKILSFDNFTKELVAGHKQFAGIEVVQDLSAVMGSLVNDTTGDNNVAEFITDNILSKTDDGMEGTAQMSFYSESTSSIPEENPSANGTFRIALIDDDIYTRQYIQQIFSKIKGVVDFFDSGVEFIAATNKVRYALIILEVFMPGLSGFDILASLSEKKYPAPTIIYSSVSNRDAIMQSLSLGAKTYLVKPLKPEVLLQKALEAMRTN